MLSSLQNLIFLCQQKKITALWGLWTRYIALNSQVSLCGDVVKAYDFQSVEYYMKVMFGKPLVQGKLYYCFLMNSE